MKQYSFSKDKRLISNRQFKDILAFGSRLNDNMLTVYIAENKCGYSRLGVSIGKSYGNAVERNHLKRFLREIFRQNQDQIPGNYDYLILIKKKIKNPTFEQVKKSFLALAASVKKRCDKS